MDNFYGKDVPEVKSTTTPTFTVNDFINDMKVEGEHIRTVFEGAIDKIHMREAAKKIKGLIDIQKQNGNYNCNEYMYGMLIGLECAYFSLLGEEGKFTERPKEWLDDNIPKDFKPEVADETYGHLLLKHIE